MYCKIIGDINFYLFLLMVDRDLATRERDKRCPRCGGRLHRGDYRRKPRGEPSGLGEEWKVRFSFCCSREGCRRRATPPSVRFLGRRIYVGVLVTLIAAMQHGASRDRLEEIRAKIGADRRTIERWRQWWLSEFPSTGFWKAAKGSFRTPIELSRLPQSLLEAFVGSMKESLSNLLCFLRPITTGTWSGF